jgi:hypothetical protein
VTAGLVFDKLPDEYAPISADGGEGVAYHALTVSGTHMIYLRVDGILCADLGMPRNSYAPEAPVKSAVKAHPGNGARVTAHRE